MSGWRQTATWSRITYWCLWITTAGLSNLRRRSWAPLLRKAGIPHLRLHDLRHSFASTALAHGVHPKVVQTMPGHANISITLDTYAHVLPSMGVEAAQKIGEAFAPKKSA